MQASSTEVRSTLENLNYPVAKQQLIDEAKKQNIDSKTMQALENVPNRHYKSADDVIDEVEGFQKAVQIFHKRDILQQSRNLLKRLNILAFAV